MTQPFYRRFFQFAPFRLLLGTFGAAAVCLSLSVTAGCSASGGGYESVPVQSVLAQDNSGPADPANPANPANPADPAEAFRQPLVSFWQLAGVPRDQAVELLFQALSPEQRLAQLFMIAYTGTRPGPVVQSWFARQGLGGVKVFGWNAEDTVVLAAAIRELYRLADATALQIPPFIATDQEGGWIRHVKGNTSITPGNMAIGATGSASDSFRSAYYIGLELAALGINMNFGPTVDLAIRPDSRIIGSRAFAADPMESAILSAAWSRGMQKAGILATAKHFPGHGDTELDSHGVLPVIYIDEATLVTRDLLPYRLLIAEGIPAIMSGHLAYPKISGDREPASLSPVLVKRLLRETLGFDGLVITDDLMMSGAATPGGMPETVERAKRAGNDIIMLSRELESDSAVWRRLLQLYQTDRTLADNIDRSVRRVLRAKVDYFLPAGRQAILPAANAEAQLRTPESKQFFLEHAFRSATVLNERIFRTLPAESGILFAGQFGDFFNAALARYPGAATFRFGYTPTERADQAELAAFRGRLSGIRTVVISVANAASMAYVRAALDAGKQVYLVSVLSPYFVFDFMEFVPGVAVYSFAAESYTAAIAVLAGDFKALGRLPLYPNNGLTQIHTDSEPASP